VDQEALKRPLRALLIAAALAPAAAALAAACKPKKPPIEEPPPPIDSADHPVPAVGLTATPVEQFGDASLEPLEGKSPFEAAQIYASRGQYWMARLMIEKQGLSADAKPEETELLATICAAQSDPVCIRACETKLGRKLKLDAGAPVRVTVAEAGAPQPSGEPDTELAKARNLVLKKNYAKAREMLEPRLLEGKATREETRLLLEVCKAQRDRMCIALCESKLK
jgi:hypothetical protein